MCEKGNDEMGCSSLNEGKQGIIWTLQRGIWYHVSNMSGKASQL